jgi:hypothetical protein
MPTNSLTKVDAVNEVLAASGFAPVSSLSADGPAHARIAETTLARELRSVLAEGWWFNQCYGVELPAAADGTVTIPDDILSLDGPGDDLIALQGKVYSKGGKTFAHESGVSVDVIYAHPFEDIPFVAQDYITKRTSRKFQMSRVGDPQLNRMLMVDETDARAKLMQQEGENLDANMKLNPSLRYNNRGERVGFRRYS